MKATARVIAEEVKRADSDEVLVVRRTDRLPQKTLGQAKVELGACIKAGIGPRQLKEFGDSGLIGGVVTGEKVPDYLARVVQDDAARARLGKALLKGTARVKMRTVTIIEIEHDEE